MQWDLAVKGWGQRVFGSGNLVESSAEVLFRRTGVWLLITTKNTVKIPITKLRLKLLISKDSSIEAHFTVL